MRVCMTAILIFLLLFPRCILVFIAVSYLFFRMVYFWWKKAQCATRHEENRKIANFNLQMQNVLCNFPILLVPSKYSNLSQSCETTDIFQHDRCVISAFPVLFQSTSCFPVQRDCITGVCQAIRLQLSDCRSRCLEVVLWYLRIYTFSFARYTILDYILNLQSHRPFWGTMDFLWVDIKIVNKSSGFSSFSLHWSHVHCCFCFDSRNIQRKGIRNFNISKFRCQINLNFHNSWTTEVCQ